MTLKDILKLVSIKINQKLYPNGKARILDFGSIKLKVNWHDIGGQQYDSKKSFEEINNHFYDLIAKDLSPEVFVDIGANYGFISVIAGKKFANAKIIMIEPGKKLNSYILSNMELNQIKNYELISAVCGSEIRDEVFFSINPVSSQDNRVIAPKKNWKVQPQKMVTVDSLLQNIHNVPVFMKIDVQGFEEMVMNGAQKFMSTNSNWIIKMEFGPKWLSSQNSNPTVFLTDLVKKYDVIELPGRTGFQTKSINSMFTDVLKPEDVDGFVKNIVSIDSNEKGWSDLLLRPKKN